MEDSFDDYFFPSIRPNWFEMLRIGRRGRGMLFGRKAGVKLQMTDAKYFGGSFCWTRSIIALTLFIVATREFLT